MKPEHTPHTDLQENFNRSTNTLQVVHSGGEVIDLSAIKIILSVNGNKKGEFVSPFTVKNPDGTASSDKVFTLGDCIEINTASMGLKAGDDIEMFFVDMPSRQVIQKAVLQRGSWKLPDWITPYPYGSVYSSTSGWLPTEQVSGIQDGLLTSSTIPKNDWISEDYTFGIDADEMGISTPFKVFLRIIYKSHDNSPNTITLNISTGSEWIKIASNMPEYNNIQDCVDANGATDYTTGATTYNITQYVNTTDDLEKLKVRFSFKGNADINSGKTGWVDFIGIHVEF